MEGFGDDDHDDRTFVGLFRIPLLGALYFVSVVYHCFYTCLPMLHVFLEGP